MSSLPTEPNVVSMVETTLSDASGKPWPTVDAPLVPYFHVKNGPHGIAFHLLETSSEFDADKVKDAAEDGILEAVGKLHASVAEQHDGVWTISPATSLPRGASFWFLWEWRDAHLGWMGEALAFRTSSSELAGAQLVESFPPDHSFRVPWHIEPFALRFDGVVTSEDKRLRFVGDDGSIHEFAARSVRCSDVGWSSGHCWQVDSISLDKGVRYEADTIGDWFDATGARVHSHVTFTTDRMEREAPRWAERTCALDAEPISIGCMVIGDRFVEFEMAPLEPLRIFFRMGSRTIHEVVFQENALFRIDDLTAETRFDAVLTAYTLDGRETHLPLSWSTTSSLPTVTIAEVASNAHGPEASGEYVELWNFGENVAQLEGFSLSDHPAKMGDILPSGFELGPNERCLVASAAFMPQMAGYDVPAGVSIIRIEGTLLAGGISNQGEPVILRDSMGRRLSYVPAIFVEESQCIARTAEVSARARETDDFAIGPCTPGAAL